jgi:hypothetical protein
MAVHYEPLGPGDMTLDFSGGTTPTPFAAYMRKASIKHAYEDVGEAVVYLDGSKDSPGKQRQADTFEGEFDLNFDADELYDQLQRNDLEVVPLTYVPRTAGGAGWSGLVQVTLPETVEAEKFGAKHKATISLVCKEPDGKFVWAPNTAGP